MRVVLITTVTREDLPEKVIEEEANKWELAHGGLSGRTARQFANYMAAKKEKE